SDDESFHRAVAEGAASGSVPVVWAWPGADTVYAPRWVHGDVAQMADAVHTIVTEERFDAERAAARAEVAERYALPKILEQWVRLIVAGEPPEAAPRARPLPGRRRSAGVVFGCLGGLRVERVKHVAGIPGGLPFQPVPVHGDHQLHGGAQIRALLNDGFLHLRGDRVGVRLHTGTVEDGGPPGNRPLRVA